MKVLVTGHRGYLGTVLVPMLLEAGHDVSGYDLDYYGQCTYSHGGLYRAIPTIQKDIRDAEPLDFEGFEAVVHLAGLPEASDDDLLYEVNHRACVRVALAARQAGVQRFLMASSCAVYGQLAEAGGGEEDALAPQTTFGVSRVMAERDVGALAGENFSPTYLRLAEPCGLSPRLRLDLCFNRTVAETVTRIRHAADGGSLVERPFVHVQDAARVTVAMLAGERRQFHDHAFNIGSTANFIRGTHLRELAAALAPDPAPHVVNNAAEASQPVRRLSFEKLAHTLPSAIPQWNAQRCVEQLLDAFDASALSPEDVLGPRYDRAAELQQLVAAGTLDPQLRRSQGLAGASNVSEGMRGWR